MRLAPAIVAAVAAAYFGIFLTYGLEFEDEGLILAQATRTLHGEQPYVDFETGYTPGVFYVNAALLGLFGDRAIPVRVLLAIVNTLTITLMFVLARPWAGTTLAGAAALGYACFLPVFPGMFASFNVPYPSWYTLAAWLATQAAMDRHLQTRSRAALFAAGLFAGITFAFKPNGGAFAVIACGLALALPAAGDGHPDRRFARALLVLGVLAVLALPIIDLELHFGDLMIGFVLIAGPVLALMLGRLLVVRGPCPSTADGLPAKIALVAAGAVLPTLPWLVYFLGRLGRERFLREVLLLGLGFEGVFGTSYPIPRTVPEIWSLLATIELFVIAGLGILGARHRSWFRFGLGAVVAAHLVVLARLVLRGRVPLMPEGIAQAVVIQVQLTGFLTVPPFALAAVVVVLRRPRAPRMPERRGPVVDPTSATERLLAMVAFATCLFLVLYPRIDAMHLITAAPSMLVLGAVAARRVADAWATVVGVAPRTVAVAFASLVAVLAGVAVSPGLAAGLARDRIALPSARLPIHVDAARGNEVRDFGRIIGFLEARLAPEDDLFAFPALGLVSFALGRTFPVPYDYFFAGSPDHGQEATVLARLHADPPRFIVSLNRRLGFFMSAPSYYFLLREFVHAEYTLVARAGRFDVLEHRPLRRPPASFVLLDDAPPVPANPDRAFDWMTDFDRELRRAAVLHFLATAGDAAGVAPLADRWAADEARRVLLLRSLGESGDERGLPFLVAEIADGATPRVRGEATWAFFVLLLRDILAEHIFGGDGHVIPGAAWRALPLARLQASLRSGTDPALAIIAPFVLGRAGYDEAVPDLEQQLREALPACVPPDGYGRCQNLAEALVRLGRAEHLCTLVDLLGIPHHGVQDTVPSFVLAAARRHPLDGARCLGRGLRAEEPMARVTSAYLIGQAPLPALLPELRAAVDDPDPAVRSAVAWAVVRVTAPPASP